MEPRYDEDGNYNISPPQSRIEERLRRIEKLIEDGGGGGGDAETATDADINYIKDHTWGDDSGSSSDDSGSSSNTSTNDDDDPTATDDDIQGIKESIWGN